MKNKYVITIGRQLASGGKIIGGLLSKELNIPCYDKELITIASQESGLGKEFFEQMDEKVKHSFFSSFYGFRSGYMGSDAGNYLRHETLFKIQSEVMQNLAEKESCVFVGRCADYILREHPNLISVFISADIEDRKERLIALEAIKEKDAEAYLQQIDKKRSGYYNFYSNKKWGEATSYDLCINSSKLGLDKTAEFILDYIKRRIEI